MRSTVGLARRWTATAALGDHVQAVAHLEQLVQLLADHQHRAAGARSASSSPRICAAAPTSTPQVGCETISSRGRASISRPTMNFCRLPPDSERAGACGPPALTLKAFDDGLRLRAWRAGARSQPQRAHGLAPRQQQVVRQAHLGHRAAAQALFRHEVQAERRRGRRSRPAAWSAITIACWARRSSPDSANSSSR